MKVKNYTKFSKKSENNEELNNENVENQNGVEEVVNEPEVVNQFSTGVIVRCEKLNVREKPNKEAKVLYILDRSSEVKIDTTASTTPDFYKVITASGVEGYCMAKYILVK